jgi:hypothetical protein
MTIDNVALGELIDPAWGNAVADAINAGAYVANATGAATEFTTTTTDITSATVTFTAISGARYLVIAYVRSTIDNVNQRHIITMTDGANAEAARLVDSGDGANAAGTTFELITGAGANVTRKLRGVMAGGTTGNGDTVISRIVVLRLTQ